MSDKMEDVMLPNDAVGTRMLTATGVRGAGETSMAQRPE